MRHIAALIIAVCLLSPMSAGAYVRPPDSLEAAVAARRQGACARHFAPLEAMAAETTVNGARAAYLIAHCLESLQRPSDASEAFLAAAKRYPPVADHARYHAARVALDLNRPGDAIEALGQMDAASQPRPMSQRVRLLRAAALLRSGGVADAAGVLRALVREDGLTDELLAEGWWLLAQAEEGTGDRPAAIHAYGMAWWAVPGNEFAADAVRRLRALNTGRVPPPPADARIRRGFRLLRLGRPDEASRELLEGARGRSSPDLATEAWLQIGVLRGGGRRAVSAFREAARHGRQPARTQYWLGRSLLAAGRTKEGRAVLRRTASRFGSTSWAPRSLFLIARSVEERAGWEQADALYRDLIRRYPQSGSADEARWYRSWVRFRARRYAEAESLFLDSARRHPGTPRAAANLYWAGKARASRGLDAQAILAQVAERYPLTFYGQRANARLSRTPPPPGEAPTPLRLADTEFDRTFAELDALGFEVEAAELAEASAERSGGSDMLHAAAAIRLEAGQVHEALRSSETAIAPALYGGKSADISQWMVAYPRAYWDAVQSAAEAANVNPYLLLAVMREESRFDPRAFSIAGAAGLMQLLPSTASGVAGVTLTVAQLTQPELNIKLGAQFLGGLLRRFNGDVILAVAGYNAGPYAAQRFGRMSRADLDLFFERIPFLETRVYVQRVLQSYGIYRWLYR